MGCIATSVFASVILGSSWFAGFDMMTFIVSGGVTDKTGTPSHGAAAISRANAAADGPAR